MKVGGTAYRSIRETDDGSAILVVDQTRLPGEFIQTRLSSLDEVARAITAMQVRGAPLIGVTAAYGLALALQTDSSDAGLARARGVLDATRPTAVNLRWALDRVAATVHSLPQGQRAAAAWTLAGKMAEEDVAACTAIGRHGADLLRGQFDLANRAAPLQVLTHCNAGWLATVDCGTALAPVYRLHDDGVPIHVWVSETRPRNQGLLTAWELGQHGVPCTLVVDNATSELMRGGKVDLCIVGADRVTRNGDVCNKVGTALKALAAKDAGIPFYVAAPASTIDWSLEDSGSIPIEERSPREVSSDPTLRVFNPAFDLTPARLVTALITERGVAAASAAGLGGLIEAGA